MIYEHSREKEKLLVEVAGANFINPGKTAGITIKIAIIQ
jgi:hypothetical protein